MCEDCRLNCLPRLLLFNSLSLGFLLSNINNWCVIQFKHAGKQVLIGLNLLALLVLSEALNDQDLVCFFLTDAHLTPAVVSNLLDLFPLRFERLLDFGLGSGAWKKLGPI